MDVVLTPELEKYVSEQVETGVYQTASDVIREGLRLLKQQDEEHLAALRRDVRAGFASIERGEFEEYDEETTKELAADIKARGRARLAAREQTGAQ